MKNVIALGAEARLQGQRTETLPDGTEAVIPAHWTTLAMFGGVNNSGYIRMRSALTGVVTRTDSLDEARIAVARTLEHYPVDGRGIWVEGEAAISRISKVGGVMRGCRLWEPPADVVDLSAEVSGPVVGWGVGIETWGDTVYFAPYLSVLIHEEVEGAGHERQVQPLVVHVRYFEPGEKPSQAEATTESSIPMLFKKLRSKHAFGQEVYLTMGRNELRGYYLFKRTGHQVRGPAASASALLANILQSAPADTILADAFRKGAERVLNGAALDGQAAAVRALGTVPLPEVSAAPVPSPEPAPEPAPEPTVEATPVSSEPEPTAEPEPAAVETGAPDGLSPEEAVLWAQMVAEEAAKVAEAAAARAIEEEAARRKAKAEETRQRKRAEAQKGTPPESATA